MNRKVGDEGRNKERNRGGQKKKVGERLRRRLKCQRGESRKERATSLKPRDPKSPSLTSFSDERGREGGRLRNADKERNDRDGENEGAGERRNGKDHEKVCTWACVFS